jgi:oligosaccharide repeat unit polymerase
MLIALLQIIDNTSINRDWPETVTAVWLVWTFSYFFCSWSALRTPYLLASSYLTALCMFHLGLPIPAAFGLVNLPALTQGTKGFWFQQSAWCTLVALGAFGAGFALSLNCTSKLEIPLAVAQTKRATTLDTVRWAGVGLFVASITFLVMLIAEIGNPLAYSRMDLFRHSGDLRGLALFMMTFPTAAVLLVIGAQTAWQSWRAAIVAVIALGILLLSGYRSAALFPLMVGVILWAKTGRNIPWSVAAVLVGVVVVAIPAVAILRASGTYETLSTEKISESLQKAEATDTFIELGGTAGILAATMQLVPASEPYRYGETYLGALREAIPNISFEPRRSDRDQLLKRGATREGLLQLAPSDWLTFRLEPIKFRNGEGVGFSAIAEPYLNFGFSGVVLFFSGMGFALGRLDQENLIIRPGWLLFCGSVFWPLVRTVRNDVNNFTKPLVFLYLILGAWFLATSLLRYKARPGQAPYVG